jgi:hypothetical protein
MNDAELRDEIKMLCMFRNIVETDLLCNNVEALIKGWKIV